MKNYDMKFTNPTLKERFIIHERHDKSWFSFFLASGCIFGREENEEDKLVLVPTVITVSIRIERPGYPFAIFGIARSKGRLCWKELTDTAAPAWELEGMSVGFPHADNLLIFHLLHIPLHTRIVRHTIVA